MGIGQPIVIDHVERMQKLRAFQVKVHDWISDTLMLAARAPEDVETLDDRVDKVSLGVGLVEILLGVIRVSNAMIDATSKPDLAEDLLPYAINLEAQMVPIEAYLNPDDIADYLEEASSDVSTLITSFKWSQLVFKAMSDATDIILAIETGGEQGGTAGPLRAEANAAGAAGRAASGAVAEAELDRLAAGALIVDDGQPKKLTGKAAVRARNRRARLRGRRGEKGLGLGPGRPRPSIESYTGPPGKVRIPDNLPKGFRSFWEVKNVAKLRLTWQLADFMLYAQATGRRLRLYIRPSIKGSTLPGTVMTKELKSVIKLLKQDGLIEVKCLRSSERPETDVCDSE